MGVRTNRLRRELKKSKTETEESMSRAIDAAQKETEHTRKRRRMGVLKKMAADLQSVVLNKPGHSLAARIQLRRKKMSKKKTNG